MRETVITVESVTKKFKLYSDRPASMKERIIKKMKNTHVEFHALKDVSFEVKKGSTVGLIGKNGSGKSTLLKIINRTMFPDTGKVKIKGKVASLIELGAGFHPELSGRENIYNNATIFGLTKKEIDKRLPEIIAFSELEDFIDNTLRTYSSGMYARLAFSVAIHVDADILLVDEILGVGDINFQTKCANKIYEMKDKGTTIILVTHDMGTIDRLCDYAVWLEHGNKIAEGTPRKIENMYLKHMAEEQQTRKIKEEKDTGVIEKNNSKDFHNMKTISHLGEHFGSGEVVITDYKLLDENNIERRSFGINQEISLLVNYLSNIDPMRTEVNIGFEISHIDGKLIYGTDMLRDDYDVKNLKLQKEGTVEIKIKDLKLLPGEYRIGIALKNSKDTVCYDQYRIISEFKIYGVSNDIGIVKIDHEYTVDREKIK